MSFIRYFLILLRKIPYLYFYCVNIYAKGGKSMSMTFWALRRRKSVRAKEVARNKHLDEVSNKVKTETFALEDMTVKELKQFAVDNDIEIGKARTKNEILDAIDEYLKTEKKEADNESGEE